MGAKGNILKTKGLDPPINYRKLDALNYSSIKLFDEDPLKFYNNFVLKQKNEYDEESNSLILGSIIDDIVLEYKGDISAFEQDFHKKYVILEKEVNQTTQAFLLADILFEKTKKSIVDGVITSSFESRFSEAFEEIKLENKYKGKNLTYALDDFNKKEEGKMSAKEYFEQKVENISKKVINSSLKELGVNLSLCLLYDEYTSHLFDFEADDIMTKLVIQFNSSILKDQIGGKAEIDFIKFDHKNKVIYPFDLKSIYDARRFMFNYIKYKYYLQASWYTLALLNWKNENGYNDYTIAPYSFVVVDTSNKFRPYIIELTEKNMEDAYKGFWYNDFYKKGLYELLSEIAWSMENTIWNTTKKIFINKGKIKLEES